MAEEFKDALVDQIKNMQRSDPNAKQAWVDYSDAQLKGQRDPNKQNAVVLQNFLQLFSTGGIASLQQQAQAFRDQPASLVDRVKILQKSDPNARQAWCDFCDTQLGGHKDPTRHDATALEYFLQLYASGGVGAIQQAARSAGPAGPASNWSGAGKGAWGGPPGGPPGGHGGGLGGPQMGTPVDLPGFVKTGQKASENWRNAWVVYCTLYGGGRNDPAKHDDTFNRGFVEYLGELAAHGLAALAQAEGVSLEDLENQRNKRSGSGGQPPAKRQATGFGVMDPAAQELANKVKELQRSNPQAKEAWLMYCDATYGGVKDPSRHEFTSLQTFLASYGS